MSIVKIVWSERDMLAGHVCFALSLWHPPMPCEDAIKSNMAKSWHVSFCPFPTDCDNWFLTSLNSSMLLLALATAAPIWALNLNIMAKNYCYLFSYSCAGLPSTSIYSTFLIEGCWCDWWQGGRSQSRLWGYCEFWLIFLINKGLSWYCVTLNSFCILLILQFLLWLTFVTLHSPSTFPHYCTHPLLCPIMYL